MSNVLTEEQFKQQVWEVRCLMLGALRRRLQADGTEGGAKMAPTELGAINNFLKNFDGVAPEGGPVTSDDLFPEDEDE